MKFDPEKHHRRSIRLKGIDYSLPGAYFITICAQNRECILGGITDGKMCLNEYGKIAKNEWLKTAEMRNNIELDEFVVMPNHVHGIIVITDCMGVFGNPVRYGAVRVGTMRRGTMHRAPTITRCSPVDVGCSPTDAYGVDTQRVSGDTHGARANTRRDVVRERFRKPTSNSIPTIIRGYKSTVTRQINELLRADTVRRAPAKTVWQRNYYEHIVRNEDDLNRIREYILNNPLNWKEDDLFPLSP